MSTTIEVTTPKDEQYLSLHRNWLLHQSEKTLDNAQARLTLIQDILGEGRVRRTDRQEIEALDVAYGLIARQNSDSRRSNVSKTLSIKR